MNIQRGRDHGLPDYNTVRAGVGLEKYTTFSQMTPNVDLQQKLQDLYGDIDNVDLFVGGLIEEHVEGSQLGELFHHIIRDQFIRCRDGDRFWHKNRKLPCGLVSYIEKTKLSDIIMRNTCVKYLPRNVFIVPEKKWRCDSCHREYSYKKKKKKKKKYKKI